MARWSAWSTAPISGEVRVRRTIIVAALALVAALPCSLVLDIRNSRRERHRLLHETDHQALLAASVRCFPILPRQPWCALVVKPMSFQAARHSKLMAAPCLASATKTLSLSCMAGLVS